MSQIGASEAKTHLSALLDRVELVRRWSSLDVAGQ
jgi:hypothetical protein